MDKRRQLIDSLLVARAQLGDEEAFGQLMARYHGPLRCYVARLIHSSANADDVLQEVWLTAYIRLHKLQRPASLRAWLYGIARNKVMQSQRADPGVQSLTDTIDPSVEVDDSVFADIEVAEIHCALGHLSREHREVLTLRWFEEMSYEEIAAVVGCQLGTVRSRLHHAKLAMRNLLRRDDL